MSNPNWRVYFARCFTARGVDMHAIKIGCSFNLPHRLDGVTCCQPYDCKLIATVPGELFEEAVCHLWLKSHRIAGEYFHDDPEVMEFIAACERDGKLPLPMLVSRDHLPDADEARNFMARHELTIADLARAAGVQSPRSYEVQLKPGKSPNRRFIAAMMTAALRKGRSIDWLADLRPSVPQPVREAA